MNDAIWNRCDLEQKLVRFRNNHTAESQSDCTDSQWFQSGCNKGYYFILNCLCLIKTSIDLFLKFATNNEGRLKQRCILRYRRVEWILGRLFLHVWIYNVSNISISFGRKEIKYVLTFPYSVLNRFCENLLEKNTFLFNIVL